MVRHRRIPKIAVALAVTLSVFAFADGPAHACSCAIGDPRDALHASDAAFVGALVSKDMSDQKAIYTFSVETSVKGDLGDSVDVESAAYGAACGFEVRDGRRIGILLRLQGDGDWAGGLCTQIDPDVLSPRRAVAGADGEGPIRMIVGGNFGEARILALDEPGSDPRVRVRRGRRARRAMCPGMERFVEAVSFDGVGFLSVRETSTLEIVRDVPLITGRFPSIDQVACLSEDGGVLGAVTTRRGETAVHVVRGDRDRVAFEAGVPEPGSRASAHTPWSHPRSCGSPCGAATIASSSPSAGAVRSSVSRDERHVAGVRYGGSRSGRPPSEVVVVRAGDGADRRFSLRGWNDGGDVHWADNRTLVYLPGGGDDDRAHVLQLPASSGSVGSVVGTREHRSSATGARGAWAGARCSPRACPTGRPVPRLSSGPRRSPRPRCRAMSRWRPAGRDLQGVAAGLASE